MDKELEKQKLLKRRRIDPITGCWFYSARSYCGDKSGRIQFDHKVYLIGRVSLWIWKGFNLFSKKDVVHVCRNKSCFNPDHLWECDRRDHKFCKLSKTDVKEIRELWQSGRFSQAGLSRLYGSTQVNINHIVRYKTWL